MSVYALKLPPRHPRIARLLAQRGRLFENLSKTASAQNDYQEAIAMLEAAGVKPGERWMRKAREDLTRLGQPDLCG
jgi:tetratricopeptide (TPR) repeat protein